MRFLIYVVLFAYSVSSLANPIPEFPFVILTESLDKRVKPDVVDVHFSLTSFAPESEVSLDQLRAAGTKVVNLLREKNIPLGTLESSQIDKSAKRAHRDGVYTLEIIGYELSQRFVLRLSDLEIYPSLMSELVSIDGVTEIDTLFKSTQEQKYEEELISELSAAARRRADELAEAQSRTIKKVYGIATDGSFGAALARFSLQPSSTAYFDASGPSLDFDVTMMVPEYITISQTITAVYELN